MSYPAPFPGYTFGDTCPVLNVAKKHNVDYSVALAITDYMVHDRRQPDRVISGHDKSFTDYVNLVNDCVLVAKRFDQLRKAVPDPLTAPIGA